MLKRTNKKTKSFTLNCFFSSWRMNSSSKKTHIAQEMKFGKLDWSSTNIQLISIQVDILNRVQANSGTGNVIHNFAIALNTVVVNE